MALPAMKVMRLADTLPLLPVSAVSWTISSTCSIGTPTTSAAICAMTVCVPWPTSAPAWRTTTRSISPLAVQFHRGVADIAKAQAEADVFEAAGDADAAQTLAGGCVE